MNPGSGGGGQHMICVPTTTNVAHGHHNHIHTQVAHLPTPHKACTHIHTHKRHKLWHCVCVCTRLHRHCHSLCGQHKGGVHRTIDHRVKLEENCIIHRREGNRTPCQSQTTMPAARTHPPTYMEQLNTFNQACKALKPCRQACWCLSSGGEWGQLAARGQRPVQTAQCARWHLEQHSKQTPHLHLNCARSRRHWRQKKHQ